ncbi:MAG: beta-lactamase family protein [Lewinellaceae bacterium]|nr:beta-lactamase family protein [Phaeodactylibacter sp.]MCB9036765.1 beta-lactamase family protein [Lewinellaceae bacterium]
MKSILLLSILSMCNLFAWTQPSIPPEKVQAIEKLLSEKMSAEGIPGLSIAVVIDGQLAWSDGYGMAGLENAVPARPNTLYRSASVGKPLTATAAMRLVEEGKLGLDAPIQQYCPEFPEKRWPVTARHLLGHTSGIRHYGGPNQEEELLSSRHYDNIKEALDVFKEDTLLHQPGARYTYSTYGYNALGCVVEGAAGMPFMEAMNKYLFEPAAMLHTRADDPYLIIPNRADGYRHDEEGKLRKAYFVDMSNKMPAGGYLTSAEDLAYFAAAFMNGELLDRESMALMLEPQQTLAGDTIPYGLGWGLFPGEDWYGEREAFHGGITPGVSTVLYLLPDRRFAVAIMMNLEGVGDRVGLAAQIAKLVLELGK